MLLEARRAANVRASFGIDKAAVVGHQRGQTIEVTIVDRRVELQRNALKFHNQHLPPRATRSRHPIRQASGPF